MEFRVEPEFRNKSGIYRISNTLDKRIYIGSTRNFFKRFTSHKTELRGGRHGNEKLERFYLKYGMDKLIFSVEEVVSDEKNLLEREQHYLNKLEPFGKLGFNIARIAGAPIGFPMSKKNRRKQALRMKGNSYTKGIKKTDEQKLKQSITMKANPRIFPENYISPVAKKIGMFSKDGNKIKVFNTIASVKHDGFNVSAVCSACKNGKPFYKGYFWAYLKDENGNDATNFKFDKPSKYLDKSISQFDINGKFIKKFNTAKEAEREMNYPKDSINRAFRKKLIYRRFIWADGFYFNGEDLSADELRQFKMNRTSVKISAYSNQGEYLASFNELNEAAKGFKTSKYKIKKNIERPLPHDEIFWIYE